MAATWFQRVMWLGIAVNLALGIPTLLWPEAMLAFSRFPPATPLVWVRFSALLLILLSAFYVPAAIDCQRARANAWLAVSSRLAGAVFFLGFQQDYWMLGAIDLVFFVPQAILLLRA